jgi:hypothetical protein
LLPALLLSLLAILLSTPARGQQANLALHKPATMSSQYMNWPVSLAASNCVDGNRVNGFCHTDREVNPCTAQVGAGVKPPAGLSGIWQMTLFDRPQNWEGQVEFHEAGGQWTGQIWYTRVTQTWEAITDISYSATSGTLFFHRPHGNQDYKVTIKGNTMEGAMVERGISYRWVARK